LPREGVFAGVFAVNEGEFAITVDVCVSAAAAPNCWEALTNESGTFWCLRQEEQFVPCGRFAFKVATDERPSDFMLKNMRWPPAIWNEFKGKHPGLVQNRNLLVAGLRGNNGFGEIKLMPKTVLA
jgi:hypothetical protein